MKLDVEELDSGIKRISLAGRLDITGTGQIEPDLTSHAASARGAVAVDMAGVEFITSIGMRLLMSCAKAQESRGGKLVLCGCNPLVEKALRIAGVDRLIPLTADEDGALKELQAVLEA